jgi:AcrR family transcriptional regulator
MHMRSIATDHLEPPPAGRDAASQSAGTAQPITQAGSGRATRRGYRPRPSTMERARDIRETAARYITKHGLWRFSMLSLAKHLNCLLPSLCYYYKKREELITDIILRHVETLRARTILAMDESEDRSPAGELHAFAREYLLVGLAEQDFHCLMTAFPELAGPTEGSAFTQRLDALREMVAVRLVAHAPALRGQPELAHALSQAMLDLLNGAATWLEPYGAVKPVAFSCMAADWIVGQAARS